MQRSIFIISAASVLSDVTTHVGIIMDIRMKKRDGKKKYDESTF